MTGEEQILAHIKEQAYFPRGSRVLIALSGGKDSLYLLSLLSRKQEELGIHLGLAHVNYQQRPEANGEAQALAKLAEELDLPFYLAHYEENFTEAGAREFRYAFFKNLMEAESYPILVTGHHRDDQVETILMRLIRGNHLESLQGIKEVTPFGPGQLIRPFLGFAKADLPQAVFFQDSSNSSSAYFRNRVRQTYLPLLKKENPQFDKGLLRLAQKIEQLYQILDSRMLPLDPHDLSSWRKEEESVQLYLLERYLKFYPSLQLGQDQLQQLAHILRQPGQQKLYLRQGYWLEKSYDRFDLVLSPSQLEETLSPFYLAPGQMISYGLFHFSYGIKPQGEIAFEVNLEEEGPVWLRHRQEGDHFYWRGHHRKLRRWMINEKIAAVDRARTVLVEQDKKIVGIVTPQGPCLSIPNEHGIMKHKIYVQKLERE